VEPTLRDRLRYAFDNFMARGTVALIAGLFVVSTLLILLISVIVVIIGAARDQDLGLADVIWMSLLRTLDSGTMGGDTGSFGFLGAMLLITFGGIFVISALIGVINTGIEAKIAELRKGRSQVIEQDHIVVLGWSQQVFAVLSELVAGSASRRRDAIVVLAEADKVEMEDAIRDRVGSTGRTRIVCRSGRPMDLADLEIARIHAARAIVLLAPDTDEPDADTIKTILAITKHPNRRATPYHIVAEIRDPKNVEVAKMIGGDEVELIVGGDLIARITAQTCRQAGLSVVYTELLDFAGDEIYFVEPGPLAGRSFGDALLGFENATVIGHQQAGGESRLNPPMSTALEAGDRLIVIAEDDDTARPLAEPPAIDESLIRARTGGAVGTPERTLVLGWNWRAPLIIRELDGYVPSRSTIHVVADDDRFEADVADAAAVARSATVTSARGDTTDRRLLDALDVPSYDHVIILCYSDRLDAQRADARTLMTLLHLREIASRGSRRFTIVSEMLDIRNRALAEVARADDFIVSDRLVSLLIAQIAGTKALNAVFADLFDAEGAEIYLRPAEAYVEPGAETTVATLVEAGRRQGEIAIGYRRAALAADAGANYGVRVNPPKSERITLGAGDQVIVVADD